MAQTATQKPVVVFNKGLITERGELTFPEGASVDEANMDLQRDGSRKRRLGLAYEAGSTLGPSHTKGSTTSVHTWENAGGVAGLTFVVVQNGGTLHFYQETDGALSANKKSFTVDLSSYARPVGFGASSAEVDTTVLEGIFVVASREINTIKVTYDDSTDTISVEEIQFRTRDFEFQGSVADYSEPSASATVSIEREYDTKNAGWVGDKGDAALTDYISSETAYPLQDCGDLCWSCVLFGYVQ